MLFKIVQRDDPRAKAHPNQLMTTADPQDGCSRRSNKFAKLLEATRLVIVEISQGPAEYDCVRSKLLLRFSDLGEMRHPHLWPPYETIDIVLDVVHREHRDLPLARKLRSCVAPPLTDGHI